MTTPRSQVGVALLHDEDIPACFQVLSESFGHDAPFIDIYFPRHDTPHGQAQGSERLATWKQNSNESTFLKVVARVAVENREKIIGLAVWTHMTVPPPAELEKVENIEQVWPDRNDREYMSRLWKDYIVPRTKAIADSNGKGVYVLELLAVHPEYQRLGAGTALVKWGTQAADRLGLEAIVEATPVGRRLYEQCGLSVEIEEMYFEVGHEFDDGRQKPKLSFMRRGAGNSHGF
ncbi:hypothetical protein GQ53DRAFT_845228 [Thozetella sp. PMI_491]|nr:hypothetical protein GQ53DRAFT_845228 [Thozetella sp. PMI_491]